MELMAGHHTHLLTTAPSTFSIQQSFRAIPVHARPPAILHVTRVFTWRSTMTGRPRVIVAQEPFATRTLWRLRLVPPPQRSTFKASSTGTAAASIRATNSLAGNYIPSPHGNSAVPHHLVSESVSPGARLRQWPDKLSHSLRPYQAGQHPLRMPGHSATVQHSPLQLPPRATLTLPWVPIRSP